MHRTRWLAAGIGVALLTLPLIAMAQGQPAPGSGGFDVDAATRLYLDLLQGPARARSNAYFEGGYWLILWDAVWACGVYLLLLATGLSARLSAFAERVTRRLWLQPAVYAVPFVLLTTLLTLPWSIYEGFVRENHYGLMNQSFASWLLDAAKSTAISVVVMALAFVAVFAVIRRFPRGWWLWGTGLMVTFTALGSLLFPVFLAPVFNTYTELHAGSLRDRIVAMAAANHIPAEHIYVSDASRQSKRISANVSGLGPTIRITLNDNLLHRTSPDEVVAVLGHEMGHYVLGHVWRLILLFALVFAVIFFVVSRAAPWLIARHPGWRVAGVADPAAAPVLLLLASIAGLILTPVQNTIIRTTEAQADAFGLDAARQPDAFALVAIRLSEYRKLEPGPIEEVLFFDHPSGYNRIHRAMEWKRDHVPNATMVHPVLPPG